MNNYFDSTGKYEVLANKLAELIPPEGSIKNPKQNPKLEKYRRMTNAYYDLYNNGGGNPCRKTAYYFPRTITLAKNDDWKKIIEITEPIMDKAILEASIEQGLA